jgi:hypothetical protein
MITYNICKKTLLGEFVMTEVEAPVLPRTGDFLDHEPSGLSGYVVKVMFHWSGNGVFEIEVWL